MVTTQKEYIFSVTRFSFAKSVSLFVSRIASVQRTTQPIRSSQPNNDQRALKKNLLSSYIICTIL